MKPAQNDRFINCTMEFECNADWDSLNRTDRQDVRHCAICDKNVYFCTNQDQLEAHAVQNHCVTFQETPVRQRTGSVKMNRTTPINKEELRKFIDSL